MLRCGVRVSSINVVTSVEHSFAFKSLDVYELQKVGKLAVVIFVSFNYRSKHG